MLKKLLATFIGATGIFGFSVEKHLNLFSPNSGEIDSLMPGGGA
ncbi:hypothetical protein MSUIS_04880 [Mycoplasma suis KI3806]|uniref:Uncharacterized protein n=1 Tax=Mycoplasma suis (strain KI_3806) TaxID=708248 RepID=F0V1Q0_MYCS3|nr:hypothetical protein MSUIS_04880 [Mycoplasma suis KI3806]